MKLGIFLATTLVAGSAWCQPTQWTCKSVSVTNPAEVTSTFQVICGGDGSCKLGKDVRIIGPGSKLNWLGALDTSIEESGSARVTLVVNAMERTAFHYSVTLNSQTGTGTGTTKFSSGSRESLISTSSCIRSL